MLTEEGLDNVLRKLSAIRDLSVIPPGYQLRSDDVTGLNVIFRETIIVKAALSRVGVGRGISHLSGYALTNLTRGESEEYGKRAANNIEHIGSVGGHDILLGDVVEIRKREVIPEVLEPVEVVIGRGFPRYIEIGDMKWAERGGDDVLLTDGLEALTGDDVDDAPADANTSIGRIREGAIVNVMPGYKIILYWNSRTRGLYSKVPLLPFLREHGIN